MQCLIRSLGALLCVSGALTAQSPSYSRQIQPLLTRYCVECHNAREPEGGLTLEGFQQLMQGGKRGASIDPGKPESSLLLRMIEGRQKPVMPPKKSRQPSAMEVKLIRDWISAGARNDSSPARKTLKPVTPRRVVPTPVSALAYSSDGKSLAASGRGEVILLDATTGELDSRVLIGRDRITALAFAPRAQLLAVAGSTTGEGHELRLLENGKHRVASRHEDEILEVAFHPQGRLVASASYDRLVKLWDIGEGRESHVLRDHSDAVYSVAFSPDGKLLASGGADRAVKVWQVDSGERLYTLGESTDWVYAVAWSPDGKYLAAAGVDRSIRVWAVDARGGKIVHSIFAHEHPILRLAYSRDGKTLYSISEDRTAKAWDAQTMTERRVFPKQSESLLSLAIRPDQKELAAGRFDGVLVVFDAVSGKQVRQPLPAPPPSPADHFPSREENEPNNSPGTGESLVLPVTVRGKLDRAGDLDWYRFEVKAGQEIGVQLKSTNPNLLLRLVGPDGETISESDKRFLGHVFYQGGVYSLGVRDREFRGGNDSAYRLSIGNLVVVSSIFPLGGKRGDTVQVQLEGANLGKHRTVRVTIPATAELGSRLPVPLPSGALGTPSLIVSEFPEVDYREKTNVLPIPGTANGQLLSRGGYQDWLFTARKGQRLILEVTASRIGSPLDSMIEVRDGAGNAIPRATLRSLARSFVTFRDHDSRTPAIRLDNWSELAVNDWILLGSELLRIRALPLNPDDNCRFFEDGGQRTGFLGTTPIYQSQGTPLYKVAIHPPGTSFPPNGLPVTTLYWRNDDGGPDQGRDSRIVFDPPTDGKYLIRIRDSRGEGGKGYAYRLTVREPRPDFRIDLTLPQSVSKGSAVPVRVTVKRIDEFTGPIEIRLKGLPQGFSAPVTNIPAEEGRTAFALFAEATVTSPPMPMTLELEARARIDDKEVVRTVTGKLPKLLEASDIVTSTVESEVVLRPGQESRVKVRIDRRNGFAGRVPVEVDGLPHGVRVLDIGLNGILVTPSETERTVVLYCEPWVTAMNHPFVVFARREGKGTEHAARSILLRIAR